MATPTKQPITPPSPRQRNLTKAPTQIERLATTRPADSQTTFPIPGRPSPDSALNPFPDTPDLKKSRPSRPDDPDRGPAFPLPYRKSAGSWADVAVGPTGALLGCFSRLEQSFFFPAVFFVPFFSPLFCGESSSSCALRGCLSTRSSFGLADAGRTPFSTCFGLAS